MIDRLIEKIEALNNPTVVGLDPTLEMIPGKVKKETFERMGRTPEAVAELFLEFNKSIIDAIQGLVPAVKPQIAMYERYGIAGLAVYQKTAAYAAEKGLVVIGDIKRGDISSTASAYAEHLSGTVIDGAVFDLWHQDAVTVNPYLGGDSLAPFVNACRDADKMIFVLVKTSNPGSGDIQDMMVNPDGIAGFSRPDGPRGSSGADAWQVLSGRNAAPQGSSNADVPQASSGRDASQGSSGADVLQSQSDASIPLYLHVARLVSGWGAGLIGDFGYSRVGAVVGATHPKEGMLLRQAMPNTFFLVPGYGAQGGMASDLKGFFDAEGRGCIVNSSRGITAAWKKQWPEFGSGDSGNQPGFREVGEAARAAAFAMRDDLRSAL